MTSNGHMLAEQIKAFSDQELREKLTELGMDVGPITGTTRTLYERKLVQLLTGSRSEYSDNAPSSPPKSPRKASPLKSLPVVQQTKYEPVPAYDADDFQPSKDSTINLIRARKPVPRAVIEEPVTRKSMPRPTSPFPAANAQFRKNESEGSMMDHILKFVLFGVVMIVIMILISNQEPTKALDHRA